MAGWASARRAAVLTLAGLVCQLAAGLMAGAAELAGVAALLRLSFFLLTGCAAWLLKAPLASAAAAVGLVWLFVPAASSMLEMLVLNLIIIAMYLPMQRLFDRALYEADVSRHTLALGRGWVTALLVGRGASMLSVLPCFTEPAARFATTGQYSALLGAGLVLEIVALIAVIVSCVCMVRYLWRARGLLAV